jgi:hypothetical protein
MSTVLAPGAAGALSLPAGVDWSFIEEREGMMLQGYVPVVNGCPDANSGVTIAVGFDLGGRTAASLAALGLPCDIVTLLAPYVGLRGQAAQSFLNANPVSITQSQADAIDAPAFNHYYASVAANYDAATPPALFETLQQGAQTAVVSVAYQYGTNLAAATPHFWRQVTQGEWQAAYNNLMNFGDAFPSRRHLEAALILAAIDSGALPAGPQ